MTEKIIISTKHAPAAIGPYSQAINENGTVYLSGQIPLDPHSGELVSGGFEAAAVQVLKICPPSPQPPAVPCRILSN